MKFTQAHTQTAEHAWGIAGKLSQCFSSRSCKWPKRCDIFGKKHSWTYSSRISSLFYNRKITIPKYFLKLHPFSLFYCMDVNFLHLPDTGALSAHPWVFSAQECFEIQMFEITLRICFFSLHYIELDCLVLHSENNWLSFSQASGVHFSRVGRSLALDFSTSEFLYFCRREHKVLIVKIAQYCLVFWWMSVSLLLVQQNTSTEEVLKIYFVCLNTRVLW